MTHCYVFIKTCHPPPHPLMVHFKSPPSNPAECVLCSAAAPPCLTALPVSAWLTLSPPSPLLKSFFTCHSSRMTSACRSLTPSLFCMDPPSAPSQCTACPSPRVKPISPDGAWRGFSLRTATGPTRHTSVDLCVWEWSALCFLGVSERCVRLSLPPPPRCMLNWRHERYQCDVEVTAFLLNLTHTHFLIIIILFRSPDFCALYLSSLS